jgi:methanogenic corrinoid protein MtbC1
MYSLPTMMAEMVLCESNWNAMSLGNGIPFESLIRAVRDLKPRLFWLSVSHIRTDVDFLAEFAKLSQVCRNLGTAIVVGGRALNDELRRQMTYTAYCDTMQQFETLAESLGRTGRSRNTTSLHEPNAGTTTRKRSAKKAHQ